MGNINTTRLLLATLVTAVLYFIFDGIVHDPELAHQAIIFVA